MNGPGDDYPALAIDFDPPFIVRHIERACRSDKKETHDTQNSSKTQTEGRHVRPARALYSPKLTPRIAISSLQRSTIYKAREDDLEKAKG